MLATPMPRGRNVSLAETPPKTTKQMNHLNNLDLSADSVHPEEQIFKFQKHECTYGSNRQPVPKEVTRRELLHNAEEPERLKSSNDLPSSLPIGNGADVLQDMRREPVQSTEAFQSFR